MVLVKDVQWKVRRSLAHSLHEVAAILGTEVTEADICEQVFDVFLKDLDEVRVGVLKNFAAFMKVLSPEKRKTYLEVLTQSYLEQDNMAKVMEIVEKVAAQQKRFPAKQVSLSASASTALTTILAAPLVATD